MSVVPGVARALPNVTEADIAAVFEPYVVEHFAEDDPRWLDAVRKVEAKYLAPPKKDRRWTTADGQRAPELVQRGYEETWGRVSLREQLEESKVTPFEWRGAGSLARAIGRKRVHHLLLTRALDWLAPQSVAEVGFGYGLNLLLLSMMHPGIRFSGVELTAAGVAQARALGDDPDTAASLAAFAAGPLVDPAAATRLDLRQGSADALPLADKSVDVAITVLALEQMERIRERALMELARVARKAVIMLEPFADWNADGHRLAYIRRHDYFAARVDDLPRLGLTPLVATGDLPNKLSFRAGLVVAAVEDAR
jgi:SAM-dependent methyltransferase